MSDVQRFPGPGRLAQAAADRIVAAAHEAMGARGAFRLALSGGSTPRGTYQALSSAPSLDWAGVRFFWGDERCVPPDDPESNYRMARLALLDRLPLHQDQVFRMACEANPQSGASAYEAQLRREFPDQAWPSFDVVLLGLGEDGHTASLFPGTPALDEDRAWVVANYAEAKHAWRLTLTLPVINAARLVVFLVQGAEKAAILRRVLESQGETSDYPAGRVMPLDGQLTWLVDEAAAGEL